MLRIRTGFLGPRSFYVWNCVFSGLSSFTPSLNYLARRLVLDARLLCRLDDAYTSLYELDQQALLVSGRFFVLIPQFTLFQSHLLERLSLLCDQLSRKLLALLVFWLIGGD